MIKVIDSFLRGEKGIRQIWRWVPVSVRVEALPLFLAEVDDLSGDEESARLRMLLLCRKITEAHEEELEEYDNGK